MYRTPQAREKVLFGNPSPEDIELSNPSPKETEIANAILNKGLSGVIPNMPQPSMPQPSMPQPLREPSLEEGKEDAVRLSSEKQLIERMLNSMQIEGREQWVTRNENSKVPWNPEITWGKYLNSIAEKQGQKAVDSIIDEQIKLEQERDPGKQGIPTLETTPIPEGFEVMAPTAPQGSPEGIMAAANGGLIGFATGGMNETPPAVVPPQEFMNVLSELSEEENISPDALDAVSEQALESAGSQMNEEDLLNTGIMQNVEPIEATEEVASSGIGSLVDLSQSLKQEGKEGLVHASTGEMIFDPNVLPEDQKNMLFAALETAGINPDSLIVGSENNVIDRETGLPTFFIGRAIRSIGRAVKRGAKAVGKSAKKVGGFLKKNAGTILGIAGAMTGNPWLAALGSGIGSLVEGKPLKNALLSAGLSFAGTKWVGPWIGEKLSGIQSLGIGEALSKPIGSLGEGIGGTIGSDLARTTGQGVLLREAGQKGAEAAAQAALVKGATKATVEQAATNAITNALPYKIVPDAAIQSLAGDIVKKTSQDVASKALTSGLSSYVASAPATSGLGTFAERALSKPISSVIGGAVAGAGAKAVQPLAEQYAFGASLEDEEAARRAFEEQYNFTPTVDQLYQFYTTEFVPNRQVNREKLIGGLPGYGGIFSARGGGFVDGIGGPKSDSNLARLSDGEFVFTEPSVRAMGGGDRMIGAQRMFDMMKELEQRAV